MATHYDEPHASAKPGANDNTFDRARTALTGALTELRRLTLDPLSAEVERILVDLGHAPAGANFDVDTIGKLRNWSAEHQRVAIELEAAARCCRLVERQINQRVDAFMAAGEAASTKRCIGLPDGLRATFRRGRAASRRSEQKPLPVAAAPEPRPPAPSGAPVVQYSPFVPSVPEADVAASALGPLEVRVAGRCVPRWNSLKARAVFQYLLVHQDRPTRRDVLMALQWPDHSHNSARNNLNVALYSLRSTLDGLGQDAQPILYRDGCYILNPDLTWWIDRNEFLSAVDRARQARQADRPQEVIDACRKAIQLYRGPLFEDDGGGEWYLPEQRRLEDLYEQALEDVAKIHFELGELYEAQQFGQLAISHDPCSEAIHRLLMRCYALQHQQQLVNRQYRICVAALRDELGVPPSDETTRIFRQLI